MLRNRLYYALKPLVPWSVRMTVRRWHARRKLSRIAGEWPISSGSERLPVGWRGWPDTRQFAFVISHDVEGVEGLAKVRPLAELEMELGFRSSFNFIPEGGYQVPAQLRAWLGKNGFEVGVHDLRHDGKLFRSPAAFTHSATRINSFLQDWGAVGFRAGFMLRQLDWLHHLQIQYDASTFDTDPFEPQPEGQHTIFPFWITNPHCPSPPGNRNSGLETQNSKPPSPGFLELPYTLPQDSTLFLLLREPTPAIWLQKLDWVAGHGGMALVNVHPDYLRFPGEPLSPRTFPVEHYVALLRRVREHHAGRSWHGLPREVAAWVRTQCPLPARRRPRRVCMVTHSDYTRDNRVIRYAEALAARGDQVDVFGLRSAAPSARAELINGVNVVRLQDRLTKTEDSGLGHLGPLLRFFCRALLCVTREQARRPYDFCHIHNIPDFLVFVAWYPRLRGAKIILDIHDIVPEFFSSKFGRPPGSLAVRALRLMERCSARFAHHVIISNHLWLDTYAARSASPEKCSVFINNVDSTLFQPLRRACPDDKLIILFPGGLQWHQGLDIGIRAFQKIVPEFPTAEFHIYGDGNMKPQLVDLARELGLDGRVRFFPPVPARAIAPIMANASLGVVPKRADSFGNEAYSTKIMEFMALGVPVVVSNTKIDRYYFNDSVVRFFESGNAEAMASAMAEVLRDPARRDQMVAQASSYVAQNSWETRKTDYLKLVDDLCSRL